MSNPTSLVIPMRRRDLAVAAPRLGALIATAVLAVVAVPRSAEASTVTLGVNGGPGLDQGQLCLSTQACPGNPAFQWVSGGAVSGFFSYDNVAGTASFSLTLTSDASFGGETLLTGSTVSGSNVQVALLPLGGSGQQISQIGAPINGSANLLFSPALSAVQSTPVISGLSCTLGFSSNVCGVSLGSTGLVVGPNGSGNNYSAFLTFNVTATPVPLPAALPLLLSGMGAGAAFLRRRRRA
jgi:hypothetical protein